MEKALADLKARNINIIKGPLIIDNEETWVYFADEDNNVLEFIQWYNKKQNIGCRFKKYIRTWVRK